MAALAGLWTQAESQFLALDIPANRDKPDIIYQVLGRPMRLVGFAAMAGLLFLLSGCMTAEQQRAADEDKCRGYGFRPRTDAFAECLQRIDLARSAARRYDSDFDRWDRPIVVYRSMAVPVEAK